MYRAERSSHASLRVQLPARSKIDREGRALYTAVQRRSFRRSPDKLGTLTNLVGKHAKLALGMDKPTAALILDLKQRGMLDETLIVLTTELGRLPISQGWVRANAITILRVYFLSRGRRLTARVLSRSY